MMQLAHFADYADAWLLSLQQQGKSAHTLAAYRRDLAQLVQLLPQERHSESPQRRHFVAALAIQRLSGGANAVGTQSGAQPQSAEAARTAA